MMSLNFFLTTSVHKIVRVFKLKVTFLLPTFYTRLKRLALQFTCRESISAYNTHLFGKLIRMTDNACRAVQSLDLLGFFFYSCLETFPRIDCVRLSVSVYAGLDSDIQGS